MLLVLMVQLTECNRSVIDGRPFTPRVKPSSIGHSEFEQMLWLHCVTLTCTYSHHYLFYKKSSNLQQPKLFCVLILLQ